MLTRYKKFLPLFCTCLKFLLGGYCQLKSTSRMGVFPDTCPYIAWKLTGSVAVVKLEQMLFFVNERFVIETFVSLSN